MLEGEILGKVRILGRRGALLIIYLLRKALISLKRRLEVLRS